MGNRQSGNISLNVRIYGVSQLLADRANDQNLQACELMRGWCDS